jgi:MFS family permease
MLPISLNVTDEFGKVIYQNAPLSAADIDCDETFWAVDCTRDYCKELRLATERAGEIMSIPYTVASCLAPFMGRLIDRVGRRAYLACTASILLLIVHASLALTMVTPSIPLMGQGIAYALYSSVLWPSVPLTVDKASTGTAFGIITAIQNIGLALCPLVVAFIYDRSNRYIPSVELFFTSCATAGALVGLALIMLDRRHGSKLNSIGSMETEEVEETLDEIWSENGETNRQEGVPTRTENDDVE